MTARKPRKLMSRVRSDLLGKEYPSVLDENRVDKGEYLECIDWVDCLPTEEFEDEQGIIRDEHGHESGYTLRLRLPDGRIVWGANIDFDTEYRVIKTVPSMKTPKAKKSK